ncbi:hypothetical protein [Humisphaera borealis]|uniref:Uncharacterized protein n=1 Tax=Humisphaera borealis TaxID=2807512 RepID=A0A7M2WQT5_9BACT|nr:hypothetical protein [Humisphaera borealis]QOV87915.1 hypothetical protein IPV69_16775 [Humisphaera borealis]
MSRHSILLGVVLIGLFGLPTFAADEPAKENAAAKAGLKEEVIKTWMEKQYTEMGKYETKKETLEYASIRYGEPREGNSLGDGVPDNKKTTVYPIKISFTHVTSWPKEGKTRKETVECTIVAFKDDFGDWTYRIKENKVEPVK